MGSGGMAAGGMAAGGMGGREAQAQLRAMRDALAGTSDEKLLRVLAMVERMDEAAAAEGLLRPLRFARLLFLPLDPLIVPAAAWQPGELAVPRHALVLMADAVCAALGPVGQEVRVTIAGRTTADAAVVEAAGAVLWPRAGRVLPDLAAPEGWASTGLPGPAFGPLARMAGALLRPAVPVMGLCAAVERGLALDEATLGQVLDDTAAEGPEAWRAVTALLVLRLGEHAGLLRAITAGQRLGDARLRAATEHAVEAALTRVAARTDGQAMLGGADAATAGAELTRIAELLDRIEAAGAGPDRRQRIGEVRGQLDAACRAWLAGQLEDGLAAPLLALAGGAAVPGEAPMGVDDMVAGLEEAARGLRGVEAIGRRFGNGDRYDRMLQAARAKVAALPTGGALSVVDRARMMELLAGPDEAAAMLGFGRS